MEAGGGLKEKKKMVNNNSYTHYEYKNYDEYIRSQKKRSKRSSGITIKHTSRREWIYSRMIENHVEGNSLLCVGARHSKELDFFREKGYETVDGIDLFKREGIIECDMSKMHENSYFDDKKYDIVFSCESLEHCLDFDGFLKGLDKICSKFFICFSPLVKEVNKWDCSRHKYMENAKSDTLFKRDLHASFPNFDIVFNNYYPNNNKIFFILEKKDNSKGMEFIVPIKKVKNTNRTDFFKEVPKNGICAELGCFTGCISSSIISITNPSKLYLVDPYWKIYGDKFWWRDYSTLECFESAVRRVRKTDKNNCAVFVIDTDENFLVDLKDKIFDWVYLDSTHEYNDTLRELDLLSIKIKEEGFICGHDYREGQIYNKHFGVTRAINRWLELNNDFELYLLDNHMQWIIRRKI